MMTNCQEHIIPVGHFIGIILEEKVVSRILRKKTGNINRLPLDTGRCDYALRIPNNLL